MASNTREKAQRHQIQDEKRPHAYVRHVRISSRKAKLMIDQVRGKGLDDALAILRLTAHAASPILLKLISSAAANAVNNLDMDRDSLYIAEIYANPGPTLKRFMPKARGSATSMFRRTSHFGVVLDKR
jgi:large subunit ribosomal protein L22